MHRTARDPIVGRTTTVDELERDPIEAQYRRCVRCGKARPEVELFICAGCAADPLTHIEIARVEEIATDYRGQREAIVALEGWVGGWWRK